MAVIKSGASTDQLTIDPISKAARVTLYDSAGREVSSQSKLTYVAANTMVLAAATPTDFITITGSSSKNVRVISVYVALTATSTASANIYLVKRSTADTAGTFVPATAVPFDSSDAAATANVGHYTANPTLGTSVGNTNIMRIAVPAPVPASFAGIVEDAGKELMPWGSNSRLDKPITLRGNTEVLAVNFNGATALGGASCAWRIVWIEET